MRSIRGLAVLSVLFFVLMPTSVLAASANIYMLPTSGKFNKGSMFTISIHENSGSTKVNAVQINFNYPADKLEFAGVVNSPAFSVVAQNSGGNGSVKLARGTTTSVTGDQRVAMVNFKVKSGGQAQINFTNDSQVVANDGKGTNILNNSLGATYSLSGSLKSNLLAMILLAIVVVGLILLWRRSQQGKYRSGKKS